jgi:PAS domain S-box-containing protein
VNAGAGDGDLLPRERFCAQASRFVQAVSDGVLLVDERGSIVLANSAAEALFGVSPGALTGQAIETLVPDEHRAAHAEHRRRYHERPAPRPMATVNTLLARRLDGRQFPADVSLSPMAGDGEGLTLACVRDMSWRERLRDDVRESERRYRMVVEQASEVFYRIALDGDPFRGRVEFVSPQCERLTGLPPEAFLANPARWVGLIHPEDLEALSRDTAALLSDGLERTRYYRLRNVDGEYRHVADRVVATLSEQGAVIGYQGVARDVTATVRAEQERQRLDERLRQAELQQHPHRHPRTV